MAFGIRHVFGLLPRIDLAEPYRVRTYVDDATARFGERLHMLDVVDYEVPPDDAAFEAAVATAERALDDGDNVYVHCGAGCGRAGVFAACLLVRRGVEALEAVRQFRLTRGDTSMPERSRIERGCDFDQSEISRYSLELARADEPETPLALSITGEDCQ